MSSKRAFDAIASAVLLLALSPLLAAVFLWVRLDSPGPALFRQTRLGVNERPFQILKFRTMYDRNPVAVDQFAETVVSDGVDPRITPAGRFLRKTSLDELPQLWNILVGEMSAVGPRPVLPEQRAAIPEDKLARFQVRPGLAGLAQVRGRRGLDWMDQLDADVEYVQKADFFYDLGLMVRTVWVVVTGRGIYGDAGRNWRSYLSK